MTETYGDDEFGEQQAGSAAPDIGKLREAHKKSAKAAKDAEARAEKAERELAFAKAGIDLTDKKAKYFINGYDGELEADKIKAAAIEDGFLPDPEAKPEADPPAEEDQPHPDLSGFAALQAATEGAPQNTAGVDFAKGMREIYEKGGSADDVANFLSSHGYPVASQGD